MGSLHRSKVVYAKQGYVTPDDRKYWEEIRSLLTSTPQTLAELKKKWNGPISRLQTGLAYGVRGKLCKVGYKKGRYSMPIMLYSTLPDS